MSEKAPMQSTPYVSSTGETRNPIYEGQFDGETLEQAEARRHWAKVAMEMARNAALSAPSHGEQVRDVPSVQITGHLDEVDAPVWEFINAEARKLGPITGSIDSYGLSRPNGGQPNGGVSVLWNGPKIHAVALAVRDAMNRTVCIRLLAAAPSAGSQGGDV